ncbi:hypothetical protein DGN16_05835 [Xanthomonas citri pv. fuscans]|uniref:hypothetical protein n=1 Tax=Xanthomonas citri TaxID=346 RepID=UPI00062B8655|nr:hypothetical protein [Xanthomonas citri]KKY08440.1 hypothetical protein ST33_24155 [Xanthomonas citri pv. fuscans]QWN02776.1 hypothetical protein DGN16_05835 [Xanthomonas citri pv. fuscans]
MPAETQLRIASQLLGHLLSQQSNRTIPGSMLDIRYSLDVAAELMRQQNGGNGAPPTYDYAPPQPAEEPRTREALIVREMVSQDQWRANRQRKAAPDPTATPRKKPTLH